MSSGDSEAWPGAAARRESDPSELTGSGSATRVRTPSGEGGSARRESEPPPGTPFHAPLSGLPPLIPRDGWEGQENADSEAAQIFCSFFSSQPTSKLRALASTRNRSNSAGKKSFCSKVCTPSLMYSLATAVSCHLPTIKVKPMFSNLL